VAKRLFATPLAEETRMDSSELSRGTTLVPVARIGSPLLLKTSLPLPPGCCSTCERANLPQYSGPYCPRQRLKGQAAAARADLDCLRSCTGTALL